MPGPEKTRLIIVDDVADTRESIRRMLQFEPAIEVIGSARSGREAIDLAVQSRPDVVLMDINMPDIDGITATETIRRQSPFTQVVMLSVQSDASYMRRAMLAGARDFLPKPPVLDELVSAILRAGQMAREERAKAAETAALTGGVTGPLPGMNGQSGQVIVVYSAKGGAGTTTLATNLAVSLHSKEQRAVIVDASLQYGDVSVFLNEQAKNTIYDLALRAEELDPDVVRSVMVTHQPTGLHILACPPRPESAVEVRGEHFARILEFLRQAYTYIVVDTSPFLSEPVQVALDQANLIVLVTTQEIAAIKSTSQFLNLTDDSDIAREQILLVMNKHDRKIAITPEKVGENLRQPVSAVIPADERQVITSINRGVPFVLDPKPSPVARAVKELADLVRDRVTAASAEAA